MVAELASENLLAHSDDAGKRVWKALEQYVADLKDDQHPQSLKNLKRAAAAAEPVARIPPERLISVAPENAPRRVVPQELGAPKSTRFVHAALGRNHTLLVGSEGQVWTAGANHAGQVRVLFVKQEGGSQHFCSHPVAVTAFWLPSV